MEKIFIKIAYILSCVHRNYSEHTDLLNSIKIDTRLLIALDKIEYSNMSGGELECIAMLQNDFHMINILMGYSVDEQYKTMIHGDIRLDQLLYDGNRKVWIIDMEEYSFGDCLKDVGFIIGSVFFAAYLEIFCNDWDLNKNEKNNEEIDRYLHKKEEHILEKILPLIISFINEYEYNSGLKLDLKKLSINIGVFLIERVISRASMSYKLSTVDKAIAGIGREFIVSTDNLERILS